jgi:peptidoglycan/LPS O-acetylase OafA/YrhL
LYVATLACLAVYRTQADGGTYMRNFQYLGFGKLLDLDRVVAGLLIVPRGLDRQYLSAPSPTLWFVLLLAQYYLLFPPLSALLRRVGPIAFVAVMGVTSVGSTAWLIYEYGSVAAQTHYWAAWFPFRLLEFGAGMAIGYVMVYRPEVMRAVASSPFVLLAIVAAGVGLHTVGSMIDDTFGYWNAIAYPLVTAGFAAVAFAVVSMRPGAVLSSMPLRLIAFIGTISYTVLIVNESFLYLNDYFVLHGDQWSVGWWYFIVVLYVPLTVILAYPLAVVLGLVPKPSRAASGPSGAPVPLPAQSQAL